MHYFILLAVINAKLEDLPLLCPKQPNPAIVSKKFTLDTIVHKSPALISPLCEQSDPFAVRQSASGTHKSMGEQRRLFGFSGVDHELAAWVWRQSLVGTHVFWKVDHPGDLLASGWMAVKSTRIGERPRLDETHSGNWKRINKTTRGGFKTHQCIAFHCLHDVGHCTLCCCACQRWKWAELRDKRRPGSFYYPKGWRSLRNIAL